MKAKDYYEKYRVSIFKDPEAVTSLFTEFSHEAVDLCSLRKAKRDAACIAIMKELNDKWNALERLFRADHGGLSPIRHDGFARAWAKEIPQLRNSLVKEEEGSL